MVTDPDVVRFVELFLQSRFYKKAPVAVGNRVRRESVRNLAWEMLRGPADKDGFAEWEPVDSPIDEVIIAGFERYLNVSLPPAFKLYLMYKCLFDLDLCFAVLPEIDPRHPLGWLEWSVKASQREILRVRPWYMPFTYSRAKMGLLCFDTQRPDSEGDYPIVMVEDLNHTSSDPRPEYVEWHSSFKVYIRYVCDFLEWTNSGSDETEPLIYWMIRKGRPVPSEVPYCQPWFRIPDSQ